MADLYAVANSKIFIGGEVTAKDTVTATDFTAQAWVEIGGWTAAGAVGDTQEVIEQAVISSGRVRKVKGVRNAGTMENTFMPDGVNERSKLTRLQHLILTRLSDGKAPMRAALI